MYAHAQRRHVLLSFDNLLKILITYSYLIDPYIVRLIVRYLAQSQILKPKDVDSTIPLRMFLACLTFVHLGPVLRHFLLPFEPTEPLLLDFVRRSVPPTQFLVAFLDISIFLLQVVMLSLAFETAHYHPDLEDPLAPSPVSEFDDEETVPLVDGPTRGPVRGPIFHLRLRKTLERVIHPPPLAPRTDLPGGGAPDQNASSASVASRMAARMLLNLAQTRAAATGTNPQSTLPRQTGSPEGGTGRIPGGLNGNW